MKNIAIFASIIFLIPNVSFAALTQPQVNAILALLAAFNVDQAVIHMVELDMTPISLSIVATSTPPVSQGTYTPQFVPAQTPVQPLFTGITPSVQTVIVPPPEATSTLIQPTATTTPVIITPMNPLVISMAEIYLRDTYYLRVLSNLPLNMASTTGFPPSVTMGAATNDNVQTNNQYFNEYPLIGIPAPKGDAINYHINLFSKDGQTLERGVSPY